MVLSLGLDPYAYLHMSDIDARIMHKVMAKAQTMLNERKKQEIESLGAAVANSVARMFKQ